MAPPRHRSGVAVSQLSSRRGNLLIAHRPVALLPAGDARRQLQPAIAAPGAVGALSLRLEALAVDDAPLLDQLDEQRRARRRLARISNDHRVVLAVDAQV